MKVIFIPERVEPSLKSIITDHELQVYVKVFGIPKDDFPLVAEAKNKIIGTVWVKIMNDYGYIDSKTPSLAISLYKK